MTFRVNSMTYRIDPSRFDILPEYRLKEEHEEFRRWYNENVHAMSQEDIKEGHHLLEQMQNLLSEHEKRRKERTCSGKHEKGTQMSLLTYM